jgi:hypothetical protein
VKKENKIASLFPEYLFWDVKIENLDLKRDRDFIIPRALYMTSRNSFDTDIRKLETLYSSTQIIKHLKSTKEKISNEVCELVAKRYSVPVFHRY